MIYAFTEKNIYVLENGKTVKINKNQDAIEILRKCFIKTWQDRFWLCWYRLVIRWEIWRYNRGPIWIRIKSLLGMKLKSDECGKHARWITRKVTTPPGLNAHDVCEMEWEDDQ